MPPPSTHDPLAEGSGWRELEPAPVAEDRWPFRPGLVTRREAEVPSLAPSVWEIAVARAQGIYRRTGVRGGTAAAPQWTAARGRRRIRMEARRTGLGGRLAVEHVRPSPRPWLLAVALLCWPTALVGATVLLARPAALLDWAVVGALLAVPVGIGAVIAAVEWAETLGAVWRARRVLRAVHRAARSARTVWVTAMEVEELDLAEAPDPEPALLPEHVTASQWLSTEEMERLDGESAVAPGREPTLVWPAEVLAAEAGDAFAAEAPTRGDGVASARADLPKLAAIHLSDIEAVPEPAGGDGLVGPPPELDMGRRSPQRADPRPPEPRVQRPDARSAAAAPPAAAPPEGPVDVFMEWHPPPPWAWQ